MDTSQQLIGGYIPILVNHGPYKNYYIQSPVTMNITYNNFNVALSQAVPTKIIAHDSTHIYSKLGYDVTVTIIRTDKEL